MPPVCRYVVRTSWLGYRARVRAASTVPLATGERHYIRWGFWPLLTERLVDVIQPDICH